MPTPSPVPEPSTWARISRGAVHVFHRYADWLVGISWLRFLVLSVLLLIVASLLQKLPPFGWTWTEVSEDVGRAPTPPRPPTSSGERRSSDRNRDADDTGVVISIDDRGVRIEERPRTASAIASAAASAGVIAGSAAASAARLGASEPGADAPIRIELPGASREMIREAARAARDAAREAANEARQEAAEAVEDARRDAEDARREARQSRRTRIVHIGPSLTDLAFFWIFASAILKAVYKGRKQADARAAVATENAESEQLKRQVVEARMAAMQAQVEPHFLFNTLASIDHLIETDPPRASLMQKNLIALLRASMPQLRDANPNAHNLGREMAVIRPYLEILKVRMEERLQTELRVPDGLLSAEFPSMMVQSLVENAIKHGLEPKAEGGLLTVKAEIVDGSLAVSVADTGLGFGRAQTAGTGTGLANIRERLQLLYGSRAGVVVAENEPSGTVVTVTVPYHAQRRQAAAA